jgi:hypothetical protein
MIYSLKTFLVINPCNLVEMYQSFKTKVLLLCIVQNLAKLETRHMIQVVTRKGGQKICLKRGKTDGSRKTKLTLILLMWRIG